MTGSVLTERRGVSPVIGIVLLVALTVLLAGTAGVFLFGVGDVLGETQSQVAFETEYQQVQTGHDTLVLRHTGGDTVAAENVRVVITGATYDDGDKSLRYMGAPEGALAAGSLSTGAEVRIDEDSLDWKGLDDVDGDDDSEVVDVDESTIDALDLTGATVHILVVSDDRQSSMLLTRWEGPDPGADDD
jgi:flagellin-like protein